MNPRTTLRRLASMDREELHFRVAAAVRTASARARFAVHRPAWRGGDLAPLLDPAAGARVGDARDACGRGDVLAAHRALSRHFATRARRWPLASVERAPLAAAIRARFPTSPIDARDRADRLLAGAFDLLG